ncbi:hypothetical protein TNCV_4794771 [Trichonephila clavipes]|nr:hypothetical protein TNCV_4794771 [Trichonephila clavipes]
MRESRLRRIAGSQRSQTLTQITSQLNDVVNRAVHKRTCNACFPEWVSGAVRLREYHYSMLVIGLHVFAGQENTELECRGMETIIVER